MEDSPHFISKEDSMEVAGNAVGIDLGKRTYEMCIISRTDREDSLKLTKFLRSNEEDEMPPPLFPPAFCVFVRLAFCDGIAL